MLVDYVHSLYEKWSKTSAIFIPAHWGKLFKGRPDESGQVFKVVEYTFKDFLNFSEVVAQLGPLPNFMITKAVQLIVFADGRCGFRYSYEDDLTFMNLSQIDNIPRLRDYQLPVSAAKKRDLLEMLNNRIIPSKYRTFYRALP